jgi:aerobic carbon-monoxide dehydrogenase medium subunit
MKPAPFAYARAATLDEAFGLLAEYGDDAKILAGGQSLMATLNMRLSEPEVLVDINYIDGLAGIEDTGAALRIGAMTRHVDVETSDLIAIHTPLIAAAMDHIAHPAIRNRGTFGGSIAFADPAAELPASAVALQATMHISGKDGSRDVAAAEFFEGLYETAIGPGEILTAISVPKIAPGWKSGFMELARRHGDYAIIGLAAQVELNGGTFGDARLVFFNAGDRPVSAPNTASLLAGQSWSDELAEKLSVSLKDELDPPDDLNADGPMRKHLAGVLVKRTLGSIAAPLAGDQ